MILEEVRNILKQYYTEYDRYTYDGHIYWIYKEPGTYNCAFKIYQKYAFDILKTIDVSLYGEHIKYNKKCKKIPYKEYDNEELLIKIISEFKEKVKNIESQIKIKKLQKDFN